ncbi:efflux RND transporter periplasmic adaptor subunit [Aquabacterium sp.]|uniref:efflux RND transporter periplasmic adaptor subunit n=1 Tax=Aquabacterium sp. TaxID=1872578 RepID=UPI003784A2C8
MKPVVPALAALLLSLATGGGYWLGSRSQARPPEAAAAAPATPAARRPLYYRNPMGLADTSPVPKKDSMGMDYIPVYADEAEPPAASTSGMAPLRISTEKVQKLGVRTEAAQLRPLARLLHAAGRVEPDERRIALVTPRFEGYVERLLVNATGQAVAAGQPLFEVYSPELLAAQREYVIAMQGLQAMQGAGEASAAGMRQLADASLARLRLWGLAEEEIAALVRTGEPRRSVTLRSPVAGIVTEKKALQGMRFMPGEALYQVTDLSAVWVLADVPEQDLGLLKLGAKAWLRFDAFPGQRFEGRVAYLYPTLKAETRSATLRIELPNPQRLLRPAMFAQVDVAAGSAAAVLTVPDSAVIDTGTRRLVLVQRGEGRFEPRDVTLGARGDEHVEVLQGLQPGEQVVVAANFLIDAESNLKAVVGAMAASATTAAPLAR